MLKFFPDKPYLSSPSELRSWEKSGDYLCQQKLDGWRIILTRTKEGFIATTRQNNLQYSKDFCKLFGAELKCLKKQIPLGTQLDGEWISRRVVKHVKTPFYVIFDALRWGEQWLINEELETRLKRLRELPLSGQFKMVESPDSNWLEYYSEQKSNPLSEGVVVKKRTSIMVASRKRCEKSRDLFKIKYR